MKESQAKPKRVFFFGAGASRAAGYPLTEHLACGVAHSLCGAKEPEFSQLMHYLAKVHKVCEKGLGEGRDFWDGWITNGSGPAGLMPGGLPSIIHVLSLLDVFISEDLVLYDQGKGGGQVDRRKMEEIRERLIQCLAIAFKDFDASSRSGAAWLRKFVGGLSPSADALITTNWDLLLDKAVFESAKKVESDEFIDYGTDACVTDISGEEPIQPLHVSSALPLLKLHGSFGWLYCRRCSKLYSNPHWPIADLGYGTPREGNDDKCECGTKLCSLLVTPTFFKSYDNRHLSNIWSSALSKLCKADEWHVVGYSFPMDDLHIRALMLRALMMRAKPPTIILVTYSNSDEDKKALNSRVTELFGIQDVRFEFGGAEKYLRGISRLS